MKTKLLVFSLLVLLSISMIAAEEFGHDGHEGDDDLGEGTGSAAIAFSMMGFIYVAVRRAQVYSKYLGEDKKQIKDVIKGVYRKYRKPLIIFHNIVNILATVFAGIHGIIMTSSGEGESSVIFGWIAGGAMFLLTVSGILIWYRFKPIWDYRASKTALRFVHRQWLFTGIYLIAFLIHLA